MRLSYSDLSKLPEDVLTELSELVPMYDELAHTAKVHLLQSIVSRILVKLIFDAYFVGLSDSQAKKCLEMESFLSSFGEFVFLFVLLSKHVARSDKRSRAVKLRILLFEDQTCSSGLHTTNRIGRERKPMAQPDADHPAAGGNRKPAGGDGRPGGRRARQGKPHPGLADRRSRYGIA